MATTTITLRYSRRRRAFRVEGTKLYLGPAKSAAEFDAVAEYFGRRLCDNPAILYEMGLLWVDSVKFELAA